MATDPVLVPIVNTRFCSVVSIDFVKSEVFGMLIKAEPSEVAFAVSKFIHTRE
jgi:hypothetical protein